MNDDRFLTVDELCIRYKGKLTEKALANMRSAGKGPPYIKVGRKILYPMDALRTWEAARLKSKATASSQGDTR